MPRQRVQLRAFAVAAAIGLAVALILVTRSEDDATHPGRAEAPDAPAKDVAVGFLNAYAEFDVEEASTYLAHGPDVTELIASIGAQDVRGTLGQFGLYLSLLEAQGYKQTLRSCEEMGSSAPGTTLRCGFDFHSIRSDEIGRGPFSGSSFLLTVRDGEIVEASKTWATKEFGPQMWEPFASWVSAAHPEDAELMYTDASLSGVRLTERSVRLWEQRSREYADLKTPRIVKIAERFMRARNADDAGTAMSLLTDGALTARLLYNNDWDPNMPAVRLNHDQLPLAFEAERLYEPRYELIRCRPLGEAEVICAYWLETRLSRIEGEEPTHATVRLGFRGDRIDQLGFPWLSVSFPAGIPGQNARFMEWVDGTHPKGGKRLLKWVAQERVLNLTRESVDLLAGYLEEYEHSATAREEKLPLGSG